MAVIALLGMSLALENQIRGILKTFGRIVPKGAGGLFEKNVRALITDDAEIAAVILPLFQARQIARSKCAALDRRLIGSVQGDATCRMLMTIQGIGPITAVAYLAALEKPDTFKRSRAVGAWLGLTPRRCGPGVRLQKRQPKGVTCPSVKRRGTRELRNDEVATIANTLTIPLCDQI